MAIGINGTLIEVQGPNNSASGGLNRARNWIWSYSSLNSVNDPLIHSIVCSGLNEGEEANPAHWTSSGGNSYGDVVNVIFDVYQCMMV